MAVGSGQFEHADRTHVARFGACFAYAGCIIKGYIGETRAGWARRRWYLWGGNEESAAVDLIVKGYLVEMGQARQLVGHPWTDRRGRRRLPWPLLLGIAHGLSASAMALWHDGPLPGR